MPDAKPSTLDRNRCSLCGSPLSHPDLACPRGCCPLKGPAHALEAERQAEHGPSQDGHRRLGRGWAALLSEWLQKDIPDLPPHVVELMCVELKVHRAARPFLRNQDDYDDAAAYLAFAERDSALHGAATHAPATRPRS